MNIKSLKSHQIHQIQDSSEVKYYIIVYCIIILVWFGLDFVSLGFVFVLVLSVSFGFSVFGL